MFTEIKIINTHKIYKTYVHKMTIQTKMFSFWKKRKLSYNEVKLR